MKKLKLIIAATCLFTLLAGTTVSAEELADNSITESAVFTASQGTDYSYEFAKKIEKDGNSYILKDVTYKEIAKEELPQKSVIVSGLISKSDSEIAETITENGVLYNLKSITWSDDTITNRREVVSSSVSYTGQLTAPDAPNELTTPYKDPATGKTVDVTLNLQEITQGDFMWVNDIGIPITVRTYESGIYALDGKLFHYNESTLNISGSLILSMNNLDASQYRIDSVEWNGAEYSKDGETYRNAIAYGGRYVADYTALYSATVALPNAPGYKATALYEADTSTEINATIEATATYTLVPAQENTPAMLIVLSTIGIALAAAGLIFLFVFFVKKKKRRKQS